MTAYFQRVSASAIAAYFPLCNVPCGSYHHGELGINREMSVDADQPFACPSCAARVFDVAACFQYSGEDEILEDASAPPVAREDLFGWAAFAVRCHGCGHIAAVADIECA